MDITAIKRIKNMNRTITSTIIGIESIIVETNFGIPGTFLISFKGLKILKIFIYAMLGFFTNTPNHPQLTTKKSQIFQGSLRYEFVSMKKPIAIILRIISIE